jgi:Epoxide hydrolase N terminus
MLMSAGSSSPTRRTFLATLTAAGAFGLVLLAAPCDAQTATEQETTVAQRETTTGAVRPFHITVPEEVLVDLRRRIAATRWPDRETVTDRSQGVQLAKLQELVRYWGTDYD